jgi:hypothetical protein
VSNEWFEIAWINFTKAILHGQYVDDDGTIKEAEQVLTVDQREAVYALNERHADEMTTLLRSFIAKHGDAGGKWVQSGDGSVTFYKHGAAK